MGDSWLRREQLRDGISQRLDGLFREAFLGGLRDHRGGICRAQKRSTFSAVKPAEATKPAKIGAALLGEQRPLRAQDVAGLRRQRADPATRSGRDRLPVSRSSPSALHVRKRPRSSRCRQRGQDQVALVGIEAVQRRPRDHGLDVQRQQSRQ